MLIANSQKSQDKSGVKYDVCGLGNALLDYQVRVPNEFLSELGVVKNSMTLVETAFQKKAVQLVHDRFHEDTQKSSGGCAANTLAGFSNFGGRAYFFGKVGADEQGRHYRQDLEACGVKTHLVEDTRDSTGTCLALITPDAERTMLTHLGVATGLSEQDILPEPITDSAIVYIEGYLWDSPSARAASLKALDIARAQKRRTAFTYSDSFCVERHHSDFLQLAQNKIDILFCNETEALKATKKTDVREAFQEMKTWCNTVCITMGPEGALLSDRSRQAVEEITTWDVKLVDKLGAGDLFAAGFLFGLATDRSLKEAGHLGCFAATRVIQQMGARLPLGLNREVAKACLGPESHESMARLQRQAM